LFREFAVTLAVTILISAVVSLTLVPMMCAKLLKHGRTIRMRRLSPEMVCRWWSVRQAFDLVLDRQRLTLWVATGTVILTALLYVLIPKASFRSGHRLIQAFRRRRIVSYAAMAAGNKPSPPFSRIRCLEPVVIHRRRRQQVTLNSGRFLINLKPRGDRSASVADVIRRLRNETSDVAGITLYMQPVQDLTLDNTISRTQYQFTLESADATALSTYTPQLVAALRTQPQLADVVSNQEDNGLAVS